tara:strand:+ start:244 stop:504 length:261 start_codon:yes stop_codon:yes gene_type:complete
MDIDDQFELEHLFLTERKCRVCGEIKDLLDGFYLTRKDRGTIPSAYSYECKVCTVKRVTKSRKEKRNKPDIPYDSVPRIKDVYPDW